MDTTALYQRCQPAPHALQPWRRAHGQGGGGRAAWASSSPHPSPYVPLTGMVGDHLHRNFIAAGSNQVGLHGIAAEGRVGSESGRMAAGWEGKQGGGQEGNVMDGGSGGGFSRGGSSPVPLAVPTTLLT